MQHFYRLPLPLLASLLLLTSPLLVGNSIAQKPVSLVYHFPMDGSKFVPATSQIILRPTEPLIIQPSDLAVTGSRSGRHEGSLTVSDDGKTLLFTPEEPFDGSEHVSVSINPGIKSKSGGALPAISFSFDVSPDGPTPSQSPFLPDAANGAGSKQSGIHPFITPPADFPALNITTNTSPSPGYLFFTTLDFTQFAKDTGTYGSYRVVLDTGGNVYYFQHAFDSVELDFQPQPNGLMTFFELPRNKWFAMDSTYTIVDSFWIPQTYTPDTHDMELLTHHHALMLSYVPMKPYDLSAYGGSDTATFIGCVIVETDSLRNTVWIWRSWDPGHFLDTDATYDLPSETLGASPIPFDAVHMNSVQVDTDGNILLSSRELDEVTKISRQDGHIIWRLGGKHNQFTFINDSIHFSHQHAARRIANGDITLFDDGNYGHAFVKYDTTMDSIGNPVIDTIIGTTFARACEYNVDTTAMTATLVWHFDHDSTIGAVAMGYVDRLPNGNTLVNWGVYEGKSGQVLQPAITEVTPDESIVFELTLPLPYVVYRAFKFPSPNYDTGFVAEASPYTLLSGVAASSPVPSGLTLGTPYPNPSNGSSTVTIGAAPGDNLELDLYDPLGRLVRTYFTGLTPSPTFSLELASDDLPNGGYELVLRGAGGTVSKQFTILH
jgi:hypothetical protein